MAHVMVIDDLMTLMTHVMVIDDLMTLMTHVMVIDDLMQTVIKLTIVWFQDEGGTYGLMNPPPLHVTDRWGRRHCLASAASVEERHDDSCDRL